MNEDRATAAFAALSHPARLTVFRLLLREGRAGLAAGAIGTALDLPASTLSGHLAQLARADLIRFERRGTSLIYRADLDGTRALLSFLLEDCCGGRPEICQPVTEGLSRNSA